VTESAVNQPTRINEEAYYLKTGRPVEAARGLQDRMQARAWSGIQRVEAEYFCGVRPMRPIWSMAILMPRFA
jgi:hypothetical protein